MSDFHSSPIDLQWRDRKIDLTLDHWYSEVFRGVPRCSFYGNCYGYQSLKVSRRSVSQCSYDRHSNFFWALRWGHLTWPGDLALSDLSLKLSQHVRKESTNKCAKNGSAQRHFFFTKKTQGILNIPLRAIYEYWIGVPETAARKLAKKNTHTHTGGGSQ